MLLAEAQGFRSSGEAPQSTTVGVNSSPLKADVCSTKPQLIAEIASAGKELSRDPLALWGWTEVLLGVGFV